MKKEKLHTSCLQTAYYAESINFLNLKIIGQNLGEKKWY
jgi:hypothetical protein